MMANRLLFCFDAAAGGKQRHRAGRMQFFPDSSRFALAKPRRAAFSRTSARETPSDESKSQQATSSSDARNPNVSL